MTHVWSVILGLVQGLAEFLPISSSAHLALIPRIFHITDPVLSSLQFDIALHLGSGLAILFALWRDWTDVVRGAVRGDGFSRKFVGFLLVTSIPGAIFGVLFDKQAESTFRNPLLIASTLIVMGVVLWAVDRYARRAEPLENMTWTRAALIGLAQAFAIVPGVSRSGVTMTTGRALGLSRDATARYSFMAALPIIVGAGLFGLRDVPLRELLSLDWVLGFGASLVSSVIAMRWMLGYVRKHSFVVFTYYRLAIGLLVIALVLLRAI